MTKKIIITGASGHIGQELLQCEQVDGFDIHIIVRAVDKVPQFIRDKDNITFHIIEDLTTCHVTDLETIMRDGHVLIHLAAIIHEEGPIENSATVRMADNIAEAAANANVQHIINLSSISARFAELNTPNARLYGYRKLAAEHCFLEKCYDRKLITLRPPAVYGAAMNGPIALLIKFIKMGLPLPLGSAHALRDYISIDNLSHLIWYLGSQDEWPATPTLYEPCDGYSVSTKTLIQNIGTVLDRRIIVLPFPIKLLQLMSKVIGKKDLIDGAIGPVTATGNARLLADFGWLPKEKIPESLQYIKS